MTVLGWRSADLVGTPPATRHRLAIRGRWVEVWMACADGAASLSVAGARLAERVVAELLHVPLASVRVAPLLPSGRPVVLQAAAGSACGVSISHLQRQQPGGAPCSGGVVAAAACRGADIGLDIVAPADISPASLSRFLSADEQATAADARGAALVWAAKEAAFKASGLDEGFQPRRVAIKRLPSRGFEWRVRGGFHTVHGGGGFVLDDDHVLAIAVADRIPAPTVACDKRDSRPFEESSLRHD